MWQFRKNLDFWLSKYRLVLISILLVVLAGMFRLPNLENLPSGFFGDEAALAYNGWSLWETGRDEWGQFLPLTMRSFDDNKPAIYAYLTIPFVTTLGLTHQAARLPAAIFGTLLPLLVFWLLKKRTNNTSVSLLTALVIVIAPWHWEVSRTAIEAGVALVLVVASFWLLQLKNRAYWLTAIFLAVVTIFTYHTARLILPGLLLGAWWLKQMPRNKITTLMVIIFTVWGLGLSVTGSSARFTQISIFHDERAKALRLEAIREDGVQYRPLWESRVFHNKPLSWAMSFTESYLTNTSLTYLFYGGAQPPRVRIPETGQFLVIYLPFFMIGGVRVIRRWTDFDKWSIWWLLIAPVPASLTGAEIPHTYRTLFMIVPVSYLIAEGLVVAKEWLELLVSAVMSELKLLKKTKIRKRILGAVGFLYIAGMMILVSANVAKAWHQYSVHQQMNKPWSRQYGYRDLVTYINALPPEKRTKVVITQKEMEPYIFFLFYNRIHPSVYQAWPEKRISKQQLESGETDWQMFDLTFSQKACPYDEQDPNPNHLYVTGLNCELPKTFGREGNILFKDGNPMFHLDRPLPSSASAQSSR